MIKVPYEKSDEEATLVVTVGISMYGLTELGGLAAEESVVVIGPRSIGLLAVAVAKALGASPMTLVGTRESRYKIGVKLGAEDIIDGRTEDVVARVKDLPEKGADYVVDCAGNETTGNQAVHMTRQGGRICLAAFPKKPIEFDLGFLGVNNNYLYGLLGEGRSAMASPPQMQQAKGPRSC
ncbi:MAG: medium chain dehydrogenase/reductase family protein [Roseobacter sp.]